MQLIPIGRLAAVLGILFVTGCASQASVAPAPAEPLPHQPGAAAPRPPPPAPEGPPAPAASPEEIEQAKALMARGMKLYRQGEYDKAEQALKEAITIYPFLPEANLTLGKILLVRAAATRDPSLIKSARLMFEMAHELDPQAREPLLLLELFRAPRE